MTDKTMPQKEDQHEFSRRDFLSLTGAVTGVVTLASLASVTQTTTAKETEEGGHKWGMLIDTNLCIGCKYCTYACQAINGLDDDMIYNVVTLETTTTGGTYYLSRNCMHCEEAPCVHVCPVGATYHRPDGIVTMDYDLCIGCRYCQVACPYDARVFNWREHLGVSPRQPEFGYAEVDPRPRGVMEKCTFCQHRIDEGLERGLTPGVDKSATPACVVACPTGARVFGDLNDPESPINQRMDQHEVIIRLREELGTNPKVFYVPPQDA